MKRLRLREVVVVEGKYDKAVLEGLIDGLILTTEGFSIFSDEEKKALLRELGKRRGLLILTDSDAAGFAIRHYVEKIAAGCKIKHAYIPAVPGKEGRKSAPGKEGTLGVEGLPPETLRTALQRAGVIHAEGKQGGEITYTHLYEAGLSGGADSAQNRRALLGRLGLPQRLSKRALRDVLNSLYTYEEFLELTRDCGSKFNELSLRHNVPHSCVVLNRNPPRVARSSALDCENFARKSGSFHLACTSLEEKPVLFWDFHGTLSLPDVVWFDAAMEAAAELMPEFDLQREVLEEHFRGACLPWFTFDDGDTRSVAGSKAWWAHSESHFVQMFMRCGFNEEQARLLAPALREKILRPENYSLYPDAEQTLKELQRRGYQSYVLSNNYPELEDVTEALHLRPYLQGVLVSGRIGYEKPRAEIFEAARKAAGEPGEVWMIGDNPRDDIEGGRAAGFVTVAVHGKPAPAADYELENLGDILELLP